MRSVLILGARAPAALDHARRFAAQGWNVVVGDSVSCRLSGWSRAVQVCERLPSGRYAPQAYAAALNRLIRAHDIELVLPTCEEVFHLSRCRPLLPAGVRVLADAFDKLAELHSKWHFLRRAGRCGFEVPESQRVTSLEQAREWAGGRPVAIKPEYSRFGVNVRLYPEGIPGKAEPLRQAGGWVVQAYCRGRELCSYSVVDQGRLLAHVTYVPLYRLRRSSGYLFEACTVPAIEACVASMAADTRFTGQLSFDWVEGEDGRCRVLECNPRAVSGVHLFTREDPLPSALTGESGCCIRPSDDRPRMIGAVMWAAGLRASLRRRPLADWWRDLRQSRDVICMVGDRMPMLGGVLDLASHAGIAMRERCSLRAAATRDIEWDGEALDWP